MYAIGTFDSPEESKLFVLTATRELAEQAASVFLQDEKCRLYLSIIGYLEAENEGYQEDAQDGDYWEHSWFYSGGVNLFIQEHWDENLVEGVPYISESWMIEEVRKHFRYQVERSPLEPENKFCFGCSVFNENGFGCHN